MDKELTPLDALESWKEVRDYLNYILYDIKGCKAVQYTSTSLFLEPHIDKVETALKDYDRRLKLAKEYKDVNNVAKRLKALEIIKERFTIQFLKSDLPNYYGIMQIGTNPIYIKTKEEYELLREVLL